LELETDSAIIISHHVAHFGPSSMENTDTISVNNIKEQFEITKNYEKLKCFEEFNSLKRCNSIANKLNLETKKLQLDNNILFVCNQSYPLLNDVTVLFLRRFLLKN